MHTRTALSAALLVAAALTGCSSSGSTVADEAACKKAMTAQYKEAAAKGDKAPEGTKPQACQGIDDKTLQKLAGEVMSEYLESGEFGKQVEDSVKDSAESAFPEPTGPEISDDCRAWIKSELLDSTDDIDATAGYGVCGNLSTEEMDQAINAIVDELATATP